MGNCPRCGSEVEVLAPINAGLRQRLTLAGLGGNLPQTVCSSCSIDLEAALGKGPGLLVNDRVKEERKASLWRTRVNLLKKARNSMAQKAYAEAAVAYEKYLKVIEVVFETPQDKLTPELFKDRAATKELTVMASLYWDLLRIYDTHEKYRGRQIIAGQKLSLFLPYTPVAGDIIKKAEQFKETSRNPDIIKDFLKNTAKRKSRCFIATAAFDSTDGGELAQLRIFRDFVLKRSGAGRRFVAWYYAHSPRIAAFLNKNAWLKPPVRFVLKQITKITAAF